LIEAMQSTNTRFRFTLAVAGGLWLLAGCGAPGSGASSGEPSAAVAGAAKASRGAPFSADEDRPIDSNDSVPELPRPKTHEPLVADPPGPATVVCGPPVAQQSLACPGEYPVPYQCPRTASPAACVGSTALSRPGFKIVCCR
jgi:hypothetical protein